MLQDSLSILIVDDNTIDRETWKRYISKGMEQDCQFLEAETGEEAIELYNSHPVDIVLLDYNLPDQTGLDTLEQFPKKFDKPTAPVILLTGEGNESLAVEFMKRGGSDYLVKNGLSPERLVSTLRRTTREHQGEVELEEQNAFLAVLMETLPLPLYFMDETGRYKKGNHAFFKMLGLERERVIGKTVFEVLPREQAMTHQKMDAALLHQGGPQEYEGQIKGKDGAAKEVIFNRAVYHDYQGRVAGLIGVITDISERKRYEEKIHFLAMSDQLTGIPNRRLFFDRLDQAKARAKRTGKAIALLYIDLDGFKEINDSIGHGGGDFVLKTVARRILHTVRETDTACRYGGDEFAVVVENISTREEVLQISEKIIAAIGESIKYKGNNYSVGASIGIVFSLDASEDADTMISEADNAMYKAKKDGKNKAVFFD